MDIRTIRTPGLGDATYVLTHRGLAIVVDPQRDIDRFLIAAREADAEIQFVLETHVHNDYVSGGRALADPRTPAAAGWRRCRVRARASARVQYGSVHRLAQLPDDLGLFPTHGEGSFCVATAAGRTTSTIG
jgi:glyoxylase-like metal-dependent hydrolase (beta-lactamase superfamily II)